MNESKRELTAREVASYIAEMLPEMRRMAQDRHMQSLAHLLQLAQLEAELCSRGGGVSRKEGAEITSHDRTMS